MAGDEAQRAEQPARRRLRKMRADQERRERELADRLESQSGPMQRPPAPAGPQLTNQQVERVLGRAAEIDSGLEDDLAIDPTALIKAAREVGLSEASVRRALAEERLSESTTDGFFARLLVGDEIVETDVVAVDADVAAEILDGWMRSMEGLRPARVSDDVVRWEPDRSWAIRLRMSIGRETNGLRLDGSLPVSHSVAAVGPDETVVALRANTELLRRGTTGGVVATGALGTLAAIPFLAGSDGVGETVAILASAGVGVGGIGSAIVFGTRLHVNQLRAALRRPIDAVSRAEPVPKAPTVVDTVLEAANKFRQLRGGSKKKVT